jgi:hypothetical protein
LGKEEKDKHEEGVGRKNDGLHGGYLLLRHHRMRSSGWGGGRSRVSE